MKPNSVRMALRRGRGNRAGYCNQIELPRRQRLSPDPLEHLTLHRWAGVLEANRAHPEVRECEAEIGSGVSWLQIKKRHCWP
jgi:hypothetical protein